MRIDQRLEILSRGSEELTQEEIQVARFHYSLGLCFSNCSSQNQLVNWHLFYKMKESKVKGREGKEKGGGGGGREEDKRGEERVNYT